MTTRSGLEALPEALFSLSLSLSPGRASVLRVRCRAVERRDHFFAKVSERFFFDQEKLQVFDFLIFFMDQN
jgi:hypothetical protein